MDSPSASRYVVCGFRERRLHHATYNAALALGDEVHDILYLRTSGYLVLNLLDSILESLVACVDDAVGICDVAEYALRHALLLEYDGRHTVIACGRSAKYDVGRHVLLYDTAALHKTVATYAGEVLKYDAGGKYHVALERAFACYLRAYADDVVVAHLHVVADVDVVHEKVAVADDCGCLVLKSASNDDILADAVLVADTHVGTYSGNSAARHQ